MLFADLALARRLEYASAGADTEYVEAQRRLFPEIGGAVEQVAGGHAIFAGVRSPLTRAIGLGLNGFVPVRDVERMEAFYQDRGSAATVDLCPLTDQSLVERLKPRGYGLTGFKNVWVRAIGNREPFGGPLPAIDVQEACPAEADLWIGTVSQGFAGCDAVTAEEMLIPTPTFHRPGTTCFLAWIDGKPVGAAAMAVHNRLAILFSTSTRLAFRGCGVQSALLRARLAAAAAAKCDLVMAAAVPGSASQRNIERAGFALAYTKLTLTRAWTSRSAGESA